MVDQMYGRETNTNVHFVFCEEIGMRDRKTLSFECYEMLSTESQQWPPMHLRSVVYLSFGGRSNHEGED